jgi:glutamate-5-semialdehyde dehydrogenase
MTVAPLTHLIEGAVIPFGGDRYTVVPAELAAAFRPGDQLHVVQSTGALLHVPAAVRAAVTAQVDAAVDAFAQLRTQPADAVGRFYGAFADALADDAVWHRIEAANADDVHRAEQSGRSTTRLRVSARMRQDMIAGLRGWSARVAARAGDDSAGTIERVEHDGWSVEIASAPLGVIGFVFEGRPNVFADAAGVLATGNTAVLRIGGDALATARAIERHALRPALQSSGLPEGAVALVPVRERAAGWALFSDSRLALAVVRGSGPAVTQLGSVARQSGIPVSAHGTGGAWLVADRTADTERFAGAVRHSLDRKVCNTLNVVAVVRERADDLVPVLLDAADTAAAARGGVARVHVAGGSEGWVPPAEFERHITVRRAEGPSDEPRASILPLDELGTEWEWEDTPELSLVVVDDADQAVALFNAHSPQFVASLVTADPGARARFRDLVNAPFVGDGFTRWVDGQYALEQPELGLSNWENGRLLGRAGVLTGADLTTRRMFAHHDSADQHR